MPRRGIEVFYPRSRASMLRGIASLCNHLLCRCAEQRRNMAGQLTRGHQLAFLRSNSTCSTIGCANFSNERDASDCIARRISCSTRLMNSRRSSMHFIVAALKKNVWFRCEKEALKTEAQIGTIPGPTICDTQSEIGDAEFVAHMVAAASAIGNAWHLLAFARHFLFLQSWQNRLAQSSF